MQPEELQQRDKPQETLPGPEELWPRGSDSQQEPNSHIMGYRWSDKADPQSDDTGERPLIKGCRSGPHAWQRVKPTGRFVQTHPI